MRYASFSGLLILVYFSCCVTSQNNASRADWWENCAGSNPGPTNVFFYLYTRENPNQAQRLSLGNADSIKNSNFNPSHPVVFYTHGFRDWSEGTTSQAIKDEYVKNANFYNFILVDWCKLVQPSSPTDVPMGFVCNGPNGVICPNSGGTAYHTASCDALAVGEYVARMVEFLVDRGFADLTRTHLIGHSLGAHLSGAAGYHVQRLTGKKVARVTGLDPALPLFGDANVPLAQRLDHTDAEFVDVIHTAGADTSSENCVSLGFLKPLGHIDFYPNGGKGPQPGCASPVCSHSRAHEIYAESINNPLGFPSCRCQSFDGCSSQAGCPFPNYMGIQATQLKTAPEGVFYDVQTWDSSPYAKGGCRQSSSLSSSSINASQSGELEVVVIPAGHTEIIQTAINFIDPVKLFPRASITFLDQRNMVNLVSAARPFAIHRACPGVSGAEFPQTPCNTREDYETTPAQRSTFGHEVFTKGHLTPLRPFQFAKAAMDSTSYCTNIAPQDPRTNHPAWCNVEKRVFQHAAREDSGHPGYVITGTCGSLSQEEATNRGSKVPACWWKVYCYKKDAKVTAVGFKTSNNMIRVGDSATIEARKREAATPLSQWAIGEDEVINQAWAHLSNTDVRTRLLQGHYPSNDLPTPGECRAATLTAEEGQYWTDQFGLVSTFDANDECFTCSPGDDCYVENTLEPCAGGKDIVFAVVRKIFNSAIFDPDYQYLYRLANVLNRFGLDLTTTCEGGIWQIKEAWFQETKTGITPALRDAILANFGINWATAVYQDLEKPMYSGLAARILMQVRAKYMQPTIRLQSEELFATTYSPRLAYEFFQKTIQYYEEDKIRGRYDMIVVLDGSGSIGSGNFATTKSAVAGLLAPFAETQVRVGLITYSSTVTTNFQLDNTLTEAQMDSTIRAIPYPAGGTNTHLGINQAVSMFDQHVLDPKVPSVQIVLTDGQSNTPAETVRASAAAKARGIYTFAVGIGTGINNAELVAIAGDNPRHVFVIDSANPFEALEEIPLWLNIETQTIAIVRPDNDKFNDAVKAGERRYLKYPLPVEGLTIEVWTGLGDTANYFAYDFDAPSSAINNGKIENDRLVYIPYPEGAKGRLAGPTHIYVSVEGKEGDNQFEIETRTGYIEGCGFIGERGTVFNTQPVFETAQENEVIFSRDLYLGPLSSRSFGTLDRNYLRQNIDGNRFQLVAKDTFSSYVTEKRELVMNSSVSFSCSNGSRILYTFSIPIIDENNHGPVLTATSTIFTVSRPVNLNLPINPGSSQLTSTDADYEEDNARMFAGTNNSLIEVRPVKTWTAPYPVNYKYNLEIYFTEEPQPGILPVKIYVHDGVQQAEIDVTIQVV